MTRWPKKSPWDAADAVMVLGAVVVVATMFLFQCGCADASFSVAEPLTIDETTKGNDDAQKEDGDAGGIDTGLDQADAQPDRSDTRNAPDGDDGDVAHDSVEPAADADASAEAEAASEDSAPEVSFAHHPPLGPNYDDTAVAAGTPGVFPTYPQALVDNSLAHVKASEPPATWSSSFQACPGFSIDFCTSAIERPYGGGAWTSITWCRDGSSLVLPGDGAPGCPGPGDPKWW